MPCMRRTMRRKPVRVQLTPTSANQQARARHEHAGGDQEGRRARSPGTTTRSSTSSSALTTVTWRPLRWMSTPGAQQHALGVVAAARGLADRRRAVGGERRQQHARLDLGARDRQLVGDRAQPRAAEPQRREAPLARVAARRPSGAAARRPGRPGRRRIDSSPSSVNERPSWAASQPGSSRSSVPALPTSIGPPGSRASRRPGAAHGSPRRAPPRARRARAPPRAWSRCRRRAGSSRSAPARRPSRRAARRGGRSTCRPAPSAPRAARRAGSKRMFIVAA